MVELPKKGRRAEDVLKAKENGNETKRRKDVPGRDGGI